MTKTNSALLIESFINHEEYPHLYNVFAKAKTYSLEAGQHLFRQGDIPNQLALSITGEVEVSYIDEEGNYVIIEKCSAGFWFGDAAFVDGGALPYSAVALTDVSVIGIPHSHIRTEPYLLNEVYRFVAHSIVARLRIMYGKFDNLATRPLSERLIDRIKQLSGNDQIVQISHDDLASYLGVSRHKVSRAMKALDQQGVIKQSYRKVKIIR
ncbi:transcriptional regulator SdrP [Vibrio inusitatus NBRC 102082]|uniref:Transcriptional regulator SdrP n=1 Tax=Vibrio inusitatus NBRC 102082 TaxID=1219070 RepID=A0A4Y3HSW7_9VIBR|nr:Crp/Fnr family transcriptional regulator [Vibrio inusitatus]GEA49842.1 transcriptional regulator SdrP [Vibrio inusitatus NBRC 102082]